MPWSVLAGPPPQHSAQPVYGGQPQRGSAAPLIAGGVAVFVLLVLGLGGIAVKSAMAKANERQAEVAASYEDHKSQKATGATTTMVPVSTTAVRSTAAPTTKAPAPTVVKATGARKTVPDCGCSAVFDGATTTANTSVTQNGVNVKMALVGTDDQLVMRMTGVSPTDVHNEFKRSGANYFGEMASAPTSGTMGQYSYLEYTMTYQGEKVLVRSFAAGSGYVMMMTADTGTKATAFFESFQA